MQLGPGGVDVACCDGYITSRLRLSAENPEPQSTVLD